jgi:uncharacterized short protein YbdD (DUF466 family)
MPPGRTRPAERLRDAGTTADDWRVTTPALSSAGGATSGAPAPRRRLAAALTRVRAVVHAIIGVPDYDRYVAHLRERHPDCPVPSRRDFERERMSARYERPGSRCC